MANLGQFLRYYFWSSLLICLILLGLIYWLGDSSSGATIRSEKLITPDLEITVKNNVADTIYIYRETK